MADQQPPSPSHSTVTPSPDPASQYASTQRSHPALRPSHSAGLLATYAAGGSPKHSLTDYRTATSGSTLPNRRRANHRLWTAPLVSPVTSPSATLGSTRTGGSLGEGVSSTAGAGTAGAGLGSASGYASYSTGGIPGSMTTSVPGASGGTGRGGSRISSSPALMLPAGSGPASPSATLPPPYSLVMAQKVAALAAVASGRGSGAGNTSRIHRSYSDSRYHQHHQQQQNKQQQQQQQQQLLQQQQFRTPERHLMDLLHGIAGGAPSTTTGGSSSGRGSLSICSRSPSPSTSTVSCPEYGDITDKLQRLDAYRDNLTQKVTVLTEQVNAQTEKIKDMEFNLDDKSHRLSSTESVLQTELNRRTDLDSSKFDLMAEISALKYKFTFLEKDKTQTEQQLRKAQAEIGQLQKFVHHGSPFTGGASATESRGNSFDGWF